MNWQQNLLDLFLQTSCPLCQRSAAQVFCQDCDRQLNACQIQNFVQLNHPLLTNIPLFGWGVYEGALKRAIAVCKYENSPKIARELGKKIGESWQQSLEIKAIVQSGKVSVVPIPLHQAKFKTRGFNQAEIIARGFSERTKMPMLPGLLKRVKNTKPQMEMPNKLARQENLKDAFTASISGYRSVFLLDDIYTSGSTIQSAIAAFAQIKVSVLGVIVLARTQT